MPSKGNRPSQVGSPGVDASSSPRRPAAKSAASGVLAPSDERPRLRARGVTDGGPPATTIVETSTVAVHGDAIRTATRPGRRAARSGGGVASLAQEPIVHPEAAPAAPLSVEIRPSGTVVSRRSQAKRVPVVHLPVHPLVPRTPPAWMLADCQVAPARAGDQQELLQLLGGLPAAPTKAEFHAAVDHPEHDPANRLVARIAGRIVGHAEVVPRQAFVGGATVAAAALERVAVLPECRGAGHGQRLVAAAEQRMRQFNAAIAFSRTRVAASFHEMGWSVLGRDCATPGRPAEILARLLEHQGPLAASSALARPAAATTGCEAVSMRQWRHVELPAILRIYRQNAERFVGPLDRSEPYSRWLVSRGAFDSIIVALVGQDRYDLHETTARIVGYCIQSGNRVLELLADAEYPGLEREILARVCAEAIENDRQQIIFESSACDPLHRAVAGDDSVVGIHDRMIVAKLLDPLAVTRGVAPATVARVAAAGIREAVELGIDAPSFRGSVIVADGKAAVHPGRVGRSWLKLTDDELARLLLGQCDPVEAVARGTMEPSTQMAQRLAGILFPRLPLWAPAWDDVPA